MLISLCCNLTLRISPTASHWPLWQSINNFLQY